MTNEINGLSGASTTSVGAGAPAAKTRDAVTGGSSAPAAAEAAASSLHITDSATQLAALEQTLRSLPAVDPARVTQFRAAIEQGTYTVQPHQVADRLLQLEQALGPLQQG
ncbi:MAG TPA: flagellar biosynthesis anti-sigma factor FlgM [Steroidobacteraceae bacterium]|nr:flagellar biosynthesis anti-sigma factor FlgM [Steroidobacteraceae bacterium]